MYTQGEEVFYRKPVTLSQGERGTTRIEVGQRLRIEEVRREADGKSTLLVSSGKYSGWVCVSTMSKRPLDPPENVERVDDGSVAGSLIESSWETLQYPLDEWRIMNACHFGDGR